MTLETKATRGHEVMLFAWVPQVISLYPYGFFKDTVDERGILCIILNSPRRRRHAANLSAASHAHKIPKTKVELQINVTW